MNSNYVRVPTAFGDAFVKEGTEGAIATADSIVFDCDGVLIDTRKSYDAAITAVVDRLVRLMFGVELPWKKAAPLLIQGLRNTGWFNNDWDTVYAITLFTACSLPERYIANFASRPAGEARAERPSRADASGILNRISTTMRRFARTKPDSGCVSMDEFLISLPRQRRELCDEVHNYVGYPGVPPSSMLASIFDEMYHGGKLYRQMYSMAPRYHGGLGFIEDDKLIIRRSDLNALSKIVSGRLAMATGRPRLAAEYSLGKLMSFFSPEASVFIGDAEIRSSSDVNEFKKPSGKSLLLAAEKFRSKQVVYVGDSAEDWQMVVNARKSIGGIAFAGVYSTSYEPSAQLGFFRREGAELILPSARALPRLISEAVGQRAGR